MSVYAEGNKKSNAFRVLYKSGLNVSSIVRQYSYVGFTASTGTWLQYTNVYDWNFSTSGLPQKTPDPPSPPSLPFPPKQEEAAGNKTSTGLVAGVAVGVALLVVALGCGLCWFFCCRSAGGSSGKNELPPLRAVMVVDKTPTSSSGVRSSASLGTSSLEDADKSHWTARTFTYQELKEATLGFSESLLLGKGGFGSVYRGVIQMGDSDVELAIKRIKHDSRQGEKEFRAEVKSLAQLRHRNVVHLHGWCQERDDLLLVYEYMPNLSLDQHLYSDHKVLSWTERLHILRGLAAALVYMHSESKKCVLHRDIKPANVLLDSNMEAQLGDFGLSRLVEETIIGTAGVTMTELAGTRGYMAPELVISGRASAKTDLFSFGVVSLEVACGRRPKMSHQEIQLVDWAWQMQEAGTLLDVADPALDGKFDAGQLNCVLHVGLMCTDPDPSSRPSTRRVQQILNEEFELPLLPRSRPRFFIEL